MKPIVCNYRVLEGACQQVMRSYEPISCESISLVNPTRKIIVQSRCYLLVEKSLKD